MKRIHLVTDDGFYHWKAFRKIEKLFLYTFQEWNTDTKSESDNKSGICTAVKNSVLFYS